MPEARGLSLALMLAASAGDSFWFHGAASTSAHQVDWLFYFVLYVSLFFFVLIVGLMVVFVVRYRRRDGMEPEPSPSQNLPLEMLWMGVPIVVVMVIFYLGLRAYFDIRTPPAYAMEVQVRGQKWFWSYYYPQSGYEAVPTEDGQPAELHVPPNEPVKLVVTSDDVIHGFFIPAFRLKIDAVPGRYNTMWFKATQPGEYLAQCSVYCGTQHSQMRSVCVVHASRAEFDQWLTAARTKSQAALPPAQRGRRLYTGKFGCVQCHTTDGRRGIGPSFKDTFGAQVVFTDGTRAPADENYIRESILQPGLKIVASYDNAMPTFQGRIKDSEINDLLEFIKTLSVHYHPEGAPKAGEPTPPGEAAPAQPARKETPDGR